MENIQKVAYTKQELEDLKRPEINRLAKKIGINNLRGKNADMIDRMIDVCETKECEYDDMGEIIALDKIVSNERIHPVLGKYVKVVVNSRDNELREEFFANSHYSCRIRMGEEVMIPEGMMSFINKSCHTLEHYYDEKRFNQETGKYGVHTQRKVQDFFASIV